ncbi:MAG: SPOR domain-containing protein [Rhodocyclaceae bacterium]|nr:SPOR domain-containing protein [Rhodocyclaceae bacterium]
MSMPEADAQLPLKKRARRRLVGAIAMAVLAAVVLPMVMDPSPQAPVADVEIRIPGQEQAPPFAPKALAAKPAAAPPARSAAAEKPAEKAAERAAEKPPEKAPAAAPEKAPAVAEKPAPKPVEKPAEKPAEKPKADDDARRAAAILAGKAPDAAPAAVEHVILIGAFANPANVRQLQSKLGELGIKVYTEALDSPQGKKTRVRAGPFASREAAEKALEKMKRIGVNGVVATRQ